MAPIELLWIGYETTSQTFNLVLFKAVASGRPLDPMADRGAVIFPPLRAYNGAMAARALRSLGGGWGPVDAAAVRR